MTEIADLISQGFALGFFVLVFVWGMTTILRALLRVLGW